MTTCLRPACGHGKYEAHSPDGDHPCEECDACPAFQSRICPGCGRMKHEHSIVAPHGIEGVCAGYVFAEGETAGADDFQGGGGSGGGGGASGGW